MIQALDKNSAYLMVAKWYKREEYLDSVHGQDEAHRLADIKTKGVVFRCKLLGEIRNEDEYIVRNFLTDGSRMNVETLANYEFKKSDFVYLNGKMWLIDRVLTSERDEREKTLGVVRMRYGNIKHVLYLVEDDI